MKGCRILETTRRVSPQRAPRLLGAAIASLLLLSVGAEAALAEETPKREGAKASAEGATVATPSDASVPTEEGAAASTTAEDEIDDGTEEIVPLSSEEQGKTSLDESFRRQSRREWIRETRRKALKDTKFDLQLRTFYFNRDSFDDTESEALATGGSLGFKTGYFRERFALGATGYTSIKLYGPESKDGTLLLESDQRDYAVLGQGYGDFLLFEGVHAVVGLQALNTPYINGNDVRMTPNTFEAYVVQGVMGGKDGRPELRFGGGYIDEIKERNSDKFVSMSQDAGAPPGVSRGVYAAGGNVKIGELSIGAIDYYSHDIINIAYAESKYALPFGEKWRLQFAAQYSDQRSVDDDLLTGDQFSAGQFGCKAEVGYRDALLTTAFTTTENGSTNMQNPWSGYPGYTSVQVQDFNRGGEDAFMLRGAYKFSRPSGLSLYGLWVTGSNPSDSDEFSQDELDFNVQYAVGSGFLEGVALRLRYAHVFQDGDGDPNLDDVRLIVTYDPPDL